MMTKLTEHERDMWKKAYEMHEIFHDYKWLDDQDYLRLTTAISDEFAKSGKDRLLMYLLLGLADYFDEIGKKNREERKKKIEQLSMLEGIR